MDNNKRTGQKNDNDKNKVFAKNQNKISEDGIINETFEKYF